MTEGDDTFRRFHTFGCVGHERNAHEAGAGVDSAGLAGEVAAGQHRHIIFSLQAAGEFGVGQRGARPQVESGVGQFDFETR